MRARPRTRPALRIRSRSYSGTAGEGGAAVEAAIRLRPEAANLTSCALQHLYYGYRDYDGALKELELARQTLPNSRKSWNYRLHFSPARQVGGGIAVYPARS